MTVWGYKTREEADKAVAEAGQRLEEQQRRKAELLEVAHSDPRIQFLQREAAERQRGEEARQKAAREEAERKARAELEGRLYRQFRANGGTEEEWAREKGALVAEHVRRQTLESVEERERQNEELRQYFLRRPSPSFD